jgi:small multidrug resistance pump
LAFSCWRNCLRGGWNHLNEALRGFHQTPAFGASVFFYAASFAAPTLALKKIEVAVAYAVWSGAGTALIAAIGILYFRETTTALKFISILLIIVGVVGLNLSGAKQ